MTPTKYVVVPRPMPCYGMVYDIVAEGAKYPIAMTADRHHAKLAAAGFTAASAAAAAMWAATGKDLRALEVERGEDLYRESFLRGEKP